MVTLGELVNRCTGEPVSAFLGEPVNPSHFLSTKIRHESILYCSTIPTRPKNQI